MDSLHERPGKTFLPGEKKRSVVNERPHHQRIKKRGEKTQFNQGIHEITPVNLGKSLST